MASLGTHFVAFMFLVPIGTRRLLCSSSLLLKNPSLFRSKPWYFSEPRWKNVDLFFLLGALPIASLASFFIYLSISSHPTYRFAFFLQSSSIFFFWALLLLIIFREFVDPLLVNENFAFVLAGIAFLVEYCIIGKGISGLVSTVMYGLLAKSALVCACSCLVLSVKPSMFSADFALSCGMVLKGTWFLQCGLNLSTNVFSFKGCQKMAVLPNAVDAVVKCDLDEDALRGAAMANLLFVVHCIAVLIASFVMFGLLSNYRSLRCVGGDANGPLLAQLESDNAATRTVPVFEV